MDSVVRHNDGRLAGVHTGVQVLHSLARVRQAVVAVLERRDLLLQDPRYDLVEERIKDHGRRAGAPDEPLDRKASHEDFFEVL